MDFGECLKAMRKERGLTQKDFKNSFFLTYARVVYDESRYEIKKEMDLLEEYLILEKKKRSQRCLSKEQRKELDDRIDSLIKIAKIVNSADRELPANEQESLSYVVKRLLDESASAYLTEDADGEIKMIVLDNICETRILARLQMRMMDNRLFLLDFHSSFFAKHHV